MTSPATYNIRTWGCQMNEADSRRLASELERLGLVFQPDADQADVIVLNTCAVRQSAEDKVYGRLGQLKRIRQDHPEKIIGLMGCVVGVKDHTHLAERFPFVDVFMPPSEPSAMIAFLHDRGAPFGQMRHDYAEPLILPGNERGSLVSAHIPVVLGCSHACAYCVIPYRRGSEVSRPPEPILAEAASLARQGIREVTLLGQIVDRYGLDLQGVITLPRLLERVHEIEAIERIRFLTSHPIYMTDDLLYTVRDLPRVMPHIEVPIQAGSNTILAAMRRGYTKEAYIDLVGHIRDIIPNASIHTDIIVGFPGETEAHFNETYQVLEQLRLDKAHIAMYSPRPQTLSTRTMPDDVPPAEKKRRLLALDDLMERVVAEINARFVGQTVQVLVEGRHRGKWRGRIPQNKLVFFEDNRNWLGQLVDVRITQARAWSMQGDLVEPAS